MRRLARLVESASSSFREALALIMERTAIEADIGHQPRVCICAYMHLVHTCLHTHIYMRRRGGRGRGEGRGGRGALGRRRGGGGGYGHGPYSSSSSRGSHWSAWSDKHVSVPAIIAGRIWGSDLPQLGQILCLQSRCGVIPLKEIWDMFPEGRRGVLARQRVLDWAG